MCQVVSVEYALIEEVVTWANNEKVPMKANRNVSKNDLNGKIGFIKSVLESVAFLFY